MQHCEIVGWLSLLPRLVVESKEGKMLSLLPASIFMQTHTKLAAAVAADDSSD